MRTADLYRVVAARFLSRTGSEAAFFVGIWGKAAYTLNASATAMAVIMFTMSVASILGSILAGTLVDRWGPRRVLITFEVLFVPAALAMAVADNLTTLVVLVGVWAFAGAPVMTAGASFAPFLSADPRDLKRINSRVEGAGSLSFVVGPAAGALLAATVGVNWVFVLDAVTSLAAVYAIFGVRLAHPPEAAPQRSRGTVGEFTAGLQAVYRLRPLRLYVLAGTLVWMAFGAFGALEPLFFRDVVGASVETLGYMNSLFGVGFVIGASLLPRLPTQVLSARGLALLVGLVGLGTVLYVGSTDLWIIGIGAVLWAMVIGVMEPTLRTLIHRDTPHALVGRVIGTAEVHRSAGELVPLAFAPALAAAFGVQPVMIAGGLLAAVFAVLMIPEARAVDRLIGRVGAGDGDVQGIRMADEPISPNR